MIDRLPAEIVEPLLHWYDGNARVLPWRNRPTPYRVWISEIMLQQTRVDTGLPYFERFVDALPDIASLAAADEQSLLKLWEGLGYYNRVRNLQKAARIVMERYGGVLPSVPEQLEELPGIGAYTAGAIASIAYGFKAPAVDGNVLRVLSRVTAFEGSIDAPGVREKTAEALKTILPERVGDFNQSLMELGALVCVPNGAPHCAGCPLRGLCRAHALGNEENYPVKAPKKERHIECWTVLLILNGDRAALCRRPDKGLLADLWGFPSVPDNVPDSGLELWLKTWKLEPESVQPLCRAKHVFTHIEWHMTGYAVRCKGAQLPDGWVWATRDELKNVYPVPSAYRAYTAVLKQIV